jgi:hypothetical protein
MPVTAYDLTGRTAFVTGAASGIGRASAVLLSEAGSTIHCADRDTQGLDETAALIKDTGGTTAHTHVLDVTDRAQLGEAVAACERLDIMAATAGIMHSSPVLETRDEDLDRVLGMSLKGVLYAYQEAAPRAMIASGTRGSIVTMASSAVDTGGPGLLCYGAAKAAAVQLLDPYTHDRPPQRRGAGADRSVHGPHVTAGPSRRAGGHRTRGPAPGLRRVVIHNRPDPPPERGRGDALVAPIRPATDPSPTLEKPRRTLRKKSAARRQTPTTPTVQEDPTTQEDPSRPRSGSRLLRQTSETRHAR